jgi:putative hydrolase of the HAD superfamily
MVQKIVQNATGGPCQGLDAVIFDFGGVLAEEGFFEGFKAIAARHGMDAGGLAETAVDVIRRGGYVEGRATEAQFWEELRARTGLGESDEALRRELLSRFVPRGFMFTRVDKLRAAGYKVAILSDQTNWLDELDAAHGVFAHFDLVLNSYRLGKTKKDPTLFDDILAALGVAPDRALFIDDFEGHIRRARERGLHTIHYTGRQDFETRLRKFCPGLEA